MNKDNIIVGIDIGTTKIAVIIAEKIDNAINILGYGNSKSRGLNKGIVFLQIGQNDLGLIIDISFGSL